MTKMPPLLFFPPKSKLSKLYQSFKLLYILKKCLLELQEDQKLSSITFQKNNAMKCLNCGSSTNINEENCLHCNIPLSIFGTIQENIPAEVIDKKIEGCTCPNCNGIQSDIEVRNCEYCNFPMDQNNKNSQKRKESVPESGFAWRSVGQSRFSMNYDRALEGTFQSPTLNLNFLTT